MRHHLMKKFLPFLWVNRYEQQPPDFDEAVRLLWSRLQTWFKISKHPLSGQPKPPATLLIVGALVLYGLLGLYVVSPASRGVITRFGQYASTQGPGLHWRFWGVDQLKLINVEQIYTFNYHAEMLTKDENYVDMDVAVMCRIQDPRAYLFAVSQPNESIYHATASAVRQAAGQASLEKIITSGREEIRFEIEKQLRELTELYGLGIQVADVKLQDAKPPNAVQEAFDDAIRAREDEQRYINKAMAYRSEVIPAAKGSATQLLQEAEAYRNRVIQESKAEAALFAALAKAYAENPQVQSTKLRAQLLESLWSKQPKLIWNNRSAPAVLTLGDVQKSIEQGEQHD